MNPFKPVFFVLLVALALVASACNRSSAAEAPSSTTTTSTTTTVPPTTTPTLPPVTTTTTTLPAAAPTINGLPADEELMDRRVVSVKIDNHPLARPQMGIESADAVYELLVEGGLTRFIAMFQQSDSDTVGPNRSGRPTDATLMAPLGGPFQISGAQPWVERIIEGHGVEIMWEGKTTSRSNARPRPHNLFADTFAMREEADRRELPDEPPPPLFRYGPEPTPVTEQAETITMQWSEAPAVVWTWDGERYLRANGDQPHEWVNPDGETGQISADTLVVVYGTFYIASPIDKIGSPVPATETIGTAKALVFYDGGVFEAVWDRATPQEVQRLTDGNGNEVILPPGKVWVNVFPLEREITWE